MVAASARVALLLLSALTADVAADSRGVCCVNLMVNSLIDCASSSSGCFCDCLNSEKALADQEAALAANGTVYVVANGEDITQVPRCGTTRRSTPHTRPMTMNF